jgi:hypothetical protein
VQMAFLGSSLSRLTVRWHITTLSRSIVVVSHRIDPVSHRHLHTKRSRSIQFVDVDEL